MITSRQRESKAGRNEQLQVCRVWDEGGRISPGGSLTKQMPCHTAALSPGLVTLQLCPLAPLPLLLPVPAVCTPPREQKVVGPAVL